MSHDFQIFLRGADAKFPQAGGHMDAAEEILKGEFKGANQILVDVKEVGGKKQLFFTGKKADSSEKELQEAKNSE